MTFLFPNSRARDRAESTVMTTSHEIQLSCALFKPSTRERKTPLALNTVSSNDSLQPMHKHHSEKKEGEVEKKTGQLAGINCRAGDEMQLLWLKCTDFVLCRYLLGKRICKWDKKARREKEGDWAQPQTALPHKIMSHPQTYFLFLSALWVGKAQV